MADASQSKQATYLNQISSSFRQIYTGAAVDCIALNY